jgi:outer membrane immunogenic protein
MRGLLVVAAIVAATQLAQAADMPDVPVLRGAISDGLSSSSVNWQGYYVGGQVGYGSSDENFARTPSTAPLLQRLLANTIIENEMGVSGWPIGPFGKATSRSSGWGAFGGYNSQWDDVVIGVEASYLHGGFGGSFQPLPVRRIQTLSDTNIHDVSSSSLASISISDILTLRARGAYQCGIFLPYMFGGVALGNADISRSATVIDNATTTPAPGVALPPVRYFTQETLHSHLLYGYSAGLGVDMMLYHGLFARAEWEYVRFTSSVDTSINTVRLGLGYKF